MKKRKRATREEFEKVARRVVYYYVNKANRSRELTVRYFTKHENLRRGCVRRIVLKYEREGKVELNKGAGRKAKVSTPENLEKLKELLLVNPALSIREAAHLLNINYGSTQAMLLLARGQELPKRKRQEKRDKSSAQLTSESISFVADETNSDNVTSSLKVEPESGVGDEIGNRMTDMESTEQEYHFNDDVQEQFVESFFDDHGNDIDDPVEHDVEEKVCADLETPTVKVKKRKFKGKAKPVVGKVCVICLGKKADCNRTTTTTTFEENMRIIYLLENVLKISSEELVKMMKATEGENPADWVDLCEECYEIVHEAMIAHQQLQTLQKTIAECQSKIVLKLKESLSQPRKKVKAVKQNVVSRRVREVSSNKNVACESNTQESESESPVDSCLEVKMQVGKVEVTLDQPESEQDHGDWFDDAAADVDMLECQNEAEESEVVDKALEIANGTPEKPGDTVEENGVPVVVPTVVLPVPKVSVICDLCGESIRNVSLAVHKLKRHGVVMEGFSLLRCEVSGCNYETLFESLMKRHRRIHQSNRPRPFVCLFCGKSFTRSLNLKRHEDIHRNAETKPYQCDICGKGFAVNTLLYIHKRVTHFGRKFPSSNQRTRPKYETTDVHTNVAEAQAELASSERKN